MAHPNETAPDFQRMFRSFVEAAVKTIEQRDPTSSGHSFRVAALTRRLAEAVSEEKEGVFADIAYCEGELEEIELAALLHDFGKVRVREEVLLKAKKLYPQTQNIIRSRFDFIKRSIENDHLHRRIMMVEEGAPAQELAILDSACERAVSEIEECWRVISAANEPSYLSEGDFERIEEIANRTYFDLGGSRQPYLEAHEVESLQSAKGSVTSEELEEIREHAAFTDEFLGHVKWIPGLANVRRYAAAHHEKLDGSGYPARLTGDDILLPSKMMTVADIFDALTAADRPYKKAVSIERGLAMLEMEAKDRHIDSELVRLFREKKVFEASGG